MQYEYAKHNTVTSPMAMTESHLITAVIDAKQGQDNMTADIPNAFVQIDIDKKLNSKRITMQIFRANLLKCWLIFHTKITETLSTPKEIKRF